MRSWLRNHPRVLLLVMVMSSIGFMVCFVMLTTGVKSEFEAFSEIMKAGACVSAAIIAHAFITAR